MTDKNWANASFKYVFFCHNADRQEISNWFIERTGFKYTSSSAPYTLHNNLYKTYQGRATTLIVRILDPELAMHFALLGYHVHLHTNKD
jgi:hypothetical protein